MSELTPDFQAYIKNRLMGNNKSAGLEFCNRLEDPCSFTDPMSPNLTSELQRVWTDSGLSLDFKKILEAYATTDRPRPTRELLTMFARVIDKEFYWEFVRRLDLPCMAPDSAYCVQYAIVPDVSILANPEFNGAINGEEVDPGHIGGQPWLTTDYLGVMGNIFSASYGSFGSIFYAQVLRPSTDPPLTDLGSWSFEVEPDPPFEFPFQQTGSNCALKCYTGTFTVNDPTQVDITDNFLQVNGFDFPWLNPVAIMVDSPTLNSDFYDAITSNFGLYDPLFNIEAVINGNDITINIQSLLDWSQLGWFDDSDDTMAQLDFALTACP